MQPDLSILIPMLSDDYAHHCLAAAIALLIGLGVAPFLNIVIDRLPIMIQQAWDNYLAEANHTEPAHPVRLGLFTPDNTLCESCQHQKRYVYFLPIIGSLLPCKMCRPAIRYRHLTVDVLSGVLSALFVWTFGTGLSGISALIFAYFLIMLCFIDLETMLLPDTLTLPLLWIGLIINLGDVFTYTEDAIIGAAAGYAFFWIMHWAYKKYTGNDGIGYGDFKLVAAMGAWLGWQILPLLILFSSIIGLLAGLILMATHKLQKDNPIPFGPYLALSGILTLLFGPTLLSVLF